LVERGVRHERREQEWHRPEAHVAAAWLAERGRVRIRGFVVEPHVIEQQRFRACGRGQRQRGTSREEEGRHKTANAKYLAVPRETEVIGRSPGCGAHGSATRQTFRIGM